MIIVVGLLILGTVSACYLLFNWNRQVRLMEHLRFKWGKDRAKDYSYNDFQNIKTYWELKRKATLEDGSVGYIDELTWNDLDMDEVFMEINHTESSIGESYLYSQLHCLAFKTEELEQFEKLVNEMEENEKARLAIQLVFNKFGKSAWNKIPSYLFKIEDKSSYYKPLYSIIGLLPIICLLTLFINIKIGIGLVGITIALNAYIHYKHANNLAYEMEGLNAIYLMLKSAKKISNIDSDILKPYCNTLKEDGLKLGSILSLEGHFFLSTNSDLGIVQEYMGIITLSQLRIYQKFLTLLREETRALQSIYETLGRLEMGIAVASYRRSIDYWCTPKYTEDKSVEVEDIYHPLINHPIPNTVKLTKNVVITGSNASGKSTFVKSLAINGILAQTIHTVLATKFAVPLSYYMTSMAISDSVLTSESYYIAEIRSLKRIIDSIYKYPFCICFIDEILKGTNTIERIAASSSILKHLNSLNCLCLVASHDMELTQMLQNTYDNYHFRETIEDSKISFDYKIHRGPSTTRNAIKLLEVMEYDHSIISDANRLAAYFSDNQIWLKL